MSVNPYVVGQWVRGEKFYGRTALIDAILTGNRNCMWVLGTRRIGKTSLLKQLELIASASPQLGYVPIFWDFQGAESPADLHEGFADSLADAADRLADCGVEPQQVEADDLFAALRNLRRALRPRKLRPLLLCDEVEELIGLNERDPFLLRKLRRAMQSPDGIRSVLASKIKLWTLSQEKADTSPFLEGFTPPLYIQPLEDDEARALIRQTNLPSDSRPRLGEEDVERVREHCNNHPYLIQLLCEQFMEHDDLRASIENLASDPMISYFFSVDFELLTEVERNILHAIAERSTLTPDALQRELSATSATLEGSLHRLEHLGYIRRDADDRFNLANFFFRRWFRAQSPAAAGGAGSFDADALVSHRAVSAGAPERTRLGTVDDRYELLEKLGAGSMGVVYRARDNMLREVIALKVIKSEHAADAGLVERFRREILLGRDLDHPNVLKVYHLGEFEGRKYLTMKLVEGPSLARLIREQGPLPLDRAAAIAAQLAGALEAAHRRSVVHRDVKPDNVMIDADGRPLLTDFGLARLQDRAAMTLSGVFMGTPYYASAEQADMQPASELSDIYSLGVVTFEMITGRRPFVADTIPEVLKLHVHAAPPAIEELRPETPAGLCHIVRRCLEKDPADRFASAGELRAALEAV